MKEAKLTHMTLKRGDDKELFLEGGTPYRGTYYYLEMKFEDGNVLADYFMGDQTTGVLSEHFHSIAEALKNVPSKEEKPRVGTQINHSQ